jgi:hypothetical protein
MRHRLFACCRAWQPRDAPGVLEDVPRTKKIPASIRMKESKIMGYWTVRVKGEGIEYPELKGKIVRNVRFSNDQHLTAVNLEFEDNTLVSFRLEASIVLSTGGPEIAKLRGGNLAGWKRLKARSATLRVSDRKS